MWRDYAVRRNKLINKAIWRVYRCLHPAVIHLWPTSAVYTRGAAEGINLTEGI